MSGKPKVFISYSRDSEAHKRRVLELADRLNANGIDTTIDQYESFPAEGWPAWCKRQIEEVDHVLLACTETYRRRVDGREQGGVGLGVCWEGPIIQQLLSDADSRSRKFVPVLFDPGSAGHIPVEARGLSRFLLDQESGFEDLCRFLLNKPRTPKPPPGIAPDLPPDDRPWLSQRAAAKRPRTASDPDLGIPIMDKGYKNDIFISYRRQNALLPRCVKEFIVPLLTEYLNNELDWDVRIFCDFDIENNVVSWPLTLADELARSAILIPLLSRSYFRSSWYRAEFTHMYRREQECGYRTTKQPGGLIAPAIVHNGGDSLPLQVRSFQYVGLSDCVYAHLQRETKDALELEKRIRNWVPGIAACIMSAPSYDVRWIDPLSTELIELFLQKNQPQGRPSWGEK